jgi:hypothetical protein
MGVVSGGQNGLHFNIYNVVLNLKSFLILLKLLSGYENILRYGDVESSGKVPISKKNQGFLTAMESFCILSGHG